MQDHEDQLYELVRTRARTGLASLSHTEHRDTVLALFGSIGSSVRRALADAAEEWNSTTVTCQLPVELLVICFSHLTLKGVVTASHTCRHWRRSAVNEPSLWTLINLKYGVAPWDWHTYLLAMLERSRAAPLSVTMGLPSILYTRPDLLAEMMLRTQNLTMMAGAHPEHGLLTLNAPLLEQFHCDYNLDALIFVPEDLFGGNKKLHTLALPRFAIYNGSKGAVAALGTVRTLSCAIRSVDGSFDFGPLFRHCPNLESLTVLVYTRFDIKASFPIPRCLKRVRVQTRPLLHLNDRELPDFSPILAPAGRRSVAQIEFTQLKYLRWPMQQFVDAFSRGDPWSMTVLSEDAGPSFALAVDSHSGTFTVRLVGHNLEPDMLRETAPLLNNLNVLRIAALPLKWFITAKLVLPSLERLDVDIPPGGLGKTRLLHRSSQDRHGRLSAPRLQHLVVRPVADSAAPGAWTDFFQTLPADLGRWLRYDADKLREIVLMQGSLPTPVDDTDLEPLRLLAEVVSAKHAASE